MKVVTINGGGAKGLTVARLFSYLSKEDIQKVDVWAGTSVGSILALMYANGYDPSFVYDKFLGALPSVFSSSIFRRINPLGPKYSRENLDRFLYKYIDTPLYDIPKLVFVPAVNLANNRLKVFDNVKYECDDLDISAAKVAGYSCSAPTYFKPLDGIVDGGLWANDPTVVTGWGIQNKLNLKVSDLDILNISTGKSDIKKYDAKDMERWSLFSWTRPLVSWLIEGNELSWEFGAKLEGYGYYHNFDRVYLPEDISLDSVSKKSLDRMIVNSDVVSRSFIEEWERFISV